MLTCIHPSSTTTARTSITTLRQDENGALLRAVGEWDLANAHLLGQLLAEHEQAGRKFLHLDVSEVSFFDSTCLGVLVTAHRRLLATRGRLVLTGVTPFLTRLLNVTRLDRELHTTILRDPDALPDDASRQRQLVQPA